MFYNLKDLEYYKVLNIISKYAQSNLAKNKINALEPICKYTLVHEMLAQTENARMMLIAYDYIPMGGVYDIKQSIEKAHIGGLLSINELLYISSFIYACKNITSYYKQVINLKIYTKDLDEYFQGIIDLKNLKKEIDYCVSDKGNIYDHASHELASIRNKIQIFENRRKQKLQEIIANKHSMLTENLIVSRQDRLCVCVKAEYKNTFKGIVLDESASRTTVYIEPEEVVVMTNQLFSLHNQETEEINQILRILSKHVEENSHDLLTNLEIVTHLDVLFAKASFAKEYDCVLPSLNESGIIELTNARHPLIDQSKVVPIDLEIGKNYKTIIITGPNTGGKTVALKTTGLFILLAQSGILVPCKSANLNIYENIFTDIGDEQSIEQSLSTFSAHMKTVIDITNNLTENSLVLLDELGSGTDPKEGSYLAIAIIEYLKSFYATTICTTHYADLKAFAFGKTDIINASVEFDIETLAPTYKLLLGIPGSSNAIKIARRLGLATDICDHAQSLSENGSNDINMLMENLEIEANKISKLKEHQLQLELKLKEELSKLEKERKNLNKIQDEIITNAHKSATKLIEESKERANDLIQDIEKAQKNNNSKEHVLADLKYKARNLSVGDAKKEDIMQYNFSVGDMVYIKQYAKDGLIVEMDTTKNKYIVKLGALKFTFKKQDLEYRQAKKPKMERVVKRDASNRIQSHAKMELDLRGFRYEDVRDAIDKFIDNAYLAGLHQVSIIHGFGTGAVRNAAYEYLKKCPHVKSTRFGGEGEGLNGCTVVELK